tara:strand:- start:656 stop:1015 length:360 start_codon:yes stop_codon:yes gene_type:complete
MVDKSQYSIKRVVRVPQLKLEGGNDYAVKVEAKMYQEPARGTKTEGKVTLMKVVNLESGELCNILLGAVLKQLFSEEDDYVGKFYLIGVGEIEGDNTWRDYSLSEIDDPSTSTKKNTWL